MKKNIFTKNDQTIHTYVISEAGQNHDGSAEIAKQFTDLTDEVDSGEVKFQKKTINNFSIESILNANDDSFPDFGKKALLGIPLNELLGLEV